MPHQPWKHGGRGDPDDGVRRAGCSPGPVDSLQVEAEASRVGPRQKEQAASMVFHPCVLRIVYHMRLNRQRLSIWMSWISIVGMTLKGTSDEHLQNR